MTSGRVNIEHGTRKKTNEMSPQNVLPLKVLIVGAGIAGLTAAVGLRKQGHHVQVSNIFMRSIYADAPKIGV